MAEMQSLTVSLLAVVLMASPLVALSTAAAPNESSGTSSDFDIRFTGTGGVPVTQAPPGLIVSSRWEAGEWYEWKLNLNKNTTIAEINIAGGAFDVEWIRQVVPEFNDSAQHPDAPHTHPHAFQVLDRVDVDVIEFPAPEAGHKRTPVINITGTLDQFTYRLGLPGPGPATLLLRRDISPPAFEVGEVTELTHFSFHASSTTEEPTLATVYRLEAGAGDEPVPLPTTAYDTVQYFPVQGMQSDTEYTVWYTFTDWAGQVARSDNFSLRTLSAPAAPEPRLVDLRPAPGSTVLGPDVEVQARIVSPESLVPHDRVRLFLDKQEIPDGFTVQWGLVSAAFGGLKPGLHAVAVEVTNEAGGEGVARWTFTVEEDAGAPGPSALVTLLGAGAALAMVMAARRRDDSR